MNDFPILFPEAKLLNQVEIASLSKFLSAGALYTLLAATIVTVTSGFGYMWRHGNLFFGEKAQ